MKADIFRWPLLALGALFLLAAFLGRATPGKIAAGAVLLAAWYALSRRKVHSLDRGVRGTPDPRDLRR